MGFFSFFKKKSSGNQARDRLKLLLVSDRAHCSPEVLDMIRSDLIRVISKYVEIETDEVEIQITQIKGENGTDTVPALFANIPIKGCSGGIEKKTDISGKNVIYSYIREN